MNPQQRFQKLRRDFLAADRKWSDFHLSLGAKYGLNYQKPWLGSTELKTITKLREKVDRAGDALFQHIESVSPRCWKYGISLWWILTELTWEDATARGELSTLPRPGLGATESQIKEFARPLPPPKSPNESVTTNSRQP